MLVDGDDPQAAISAPRFTIDPETGRVAIEDHFDPAWIDDLRARGHEIDVVPAATATVRASRTRSSASSAGYRAGSDPRAEGGVAGL